MMGAISELCFDKSEIEGSLLQRFEHVVSHFPQQPAIVTSSNSLTYDELNQAANRLARSLVTRYGESPEPVAILLPDIPQQLIALWGVLKAGKFFVILDPISPTTHLHQIMGDLQASTLIADSSYNPQAIELANHRCSILNFNEIDASLPSDNLNLSISPTAIAAILYTSGSTGKPKGLIRDHRQILIYARNENSHHHIGVNDRQPLMAPLCFAASITHVNNALLQGATLHYLQIEREGVAHLAHWINQQAITLFRSPISLFRQFLDTLSGEQFFPSVRVLFLAGDILFKRDIDQCRRYFSPRCVIDHRYAGSEMGLVTRNIIHMDTELTSIIVPAGKPVEDVQVLILDDNGKTLAPGEIGEIAVRSRFLAPGYWHRPELTQKRFLPDPEGGERRTYLTGDLGRLLPDGTLEFCGRKDNLEKIRGYRVEPAAIEAAIYELGFVQSTTVIAQPAASGEKRLVAYILPATQTVPTVSELRTSLAQKLPEYMLPSSFVFLESLPMTATGKVDRKALPIPGGERPDLSTPYYPPRTELEEKLVEIWQDVLELDEIGINDSFLDLGGNSLLAARIIARVIDTMQVEIPLRLLFESPTIAQMAIAILQSQIPDQDFDRLLSELESMSDQEVQRELSRSEVEEIVGRIPDWQME